MGAGVGVGVVDGLPPAQPGGAGLPLERGTESVRTDQAEPVRLVDRVFDIVVGEASREVDEDRDRVADGDAV